MSTKPHFSILATSFAGGPRPRHAATILSGLWLILFFASLFSPPLLDGVERTRAEAARAIATTGDLVTLRLAPPDQAPLPYWLAAASIRLFGFNSFAVRLPQAIAVLLLMLLGHRWANQAFGARTGFYTAIAVLTSAGVFLFTRILLADVLLSLMLGAALFAFLKALNPVLATPPPETTDRARHVLTLGRRPDPESLAPGIPESPAVAWYAGPLFYPYIMWTTLALAVLTKGLVALVFFFATALLYLLLTGEALGWRGLRPFSGSLLLLAIAAPWHIVTRLRNTGGLRGGFAGHNFFKLCHVFGHVPRHTDLAGSLFWSLQLVWLFPWALFLPLGMTALLKRLMHQSVVLTGHISPDYSWRGAALVVSFYAVMGVIRSTFHLDFVGLIILLLVTMTIGIVVSRRHRGRLPLSPFRRIDPQQRTILLLCLFSALILLFSSVTANHDSSTFPAYLPLLLLIAATLTRAEQTYSANPSARRWVTFAHAAFTLLGGVLAFALAYALWTGGHVPLPSHFAMVMLHRGADLTTPAFPALLAVFACSLGPALAWMLRVQRRHIASTTAIAFTSAVLLLAAQIAFARLGPTLFSEYSPGGINARHPVSESIAPPAPPRARDGHP